MIELPGVIESGMQEGMDKQAVVLLLRRLALPIEVSGIGRRHLDGRAARKNWVLFCAGAATDMLSLQPPRHIPTLPSTPILGQTAPAIRVRNASEKGLSYSMICQRRARHAASSLPITEQLEKRKMRLVMPFHPIVASSGALPFLHLRQPLEGTFNFQKQILLLRAERAFSFQMRPLSGPTICNCTRLHDQIPLLKQLAVE
jgi:hypothetical protein